MWQFFNKEWGLQPKKDENPENIPFIPGEGWMAE